MSECFTSIKQLMPYADEKNLHFDKMNVCIWHKLFDGRKTLTHSLSNPLTHSDTHVFIYADNSNNMTQTYDRKAKSEKRKTKSEKQKESSLDLSLVSELD